MQSDKNSAYLLLGSNLGDREKLIATALSLLEERVGPLIQVSSIYETEAWGKTDQAGFLNLAVEIETSLQPLQLLDAVLGIESDLGRIRAEKWGPRLMDIDIILYGDRVVDVQEKLQIPHPEMQNRRFVLEPLAEISPNRMHPILGKSIAVLLSQLDDALLVEKK